jgi:hypothetical protein
LYDQAKRWGQFAFLELYTPLSEVAIASLSAVRRDPDRYAAHVRNAFLPVLAVSLPIVGFLFAEPRGVLLFLLGENWVPAAPMLRAIALAIAIGSIGRLALWVSLSLGQTLRTFHWTLWATPVYLVCVIVGIAQMGAMKDVGRVGLRALVYFEVVSTLALVVGLVVVMVVKPGAGMHVSPESLNAGAVSAYTSGAAYASFEESSKGTLAAGKLADFVIIDRNIFDIAPQEIRNARVVATFVGGRSVYEQSR